MTMNSEMPRFSVLVARAARRETGIGAGKEGGTTKKPASAIEGTWGLRPRVSWATLTLVGAFLELLVVRRLLHQIKDGVRQVGIRKRESLGVHVTLLCQTLACHDHPRAGECSVKTFASPPMLASFAES